VALTALFLAGLALAFLVRSYIQEKLPDLAIMNALGLLRREAASLYVGQILVLASISALIAWLISALALPWFFTLLSPFLPFQLQAKASLASFAICLAYGLVASLLASAPPLHAALRLKPAHILLGEAATQLTLRRSWLWYLPTALFIWGSAVLVSKSIVVGSWFGLGMVVAIGSFAGGGWLLLRFLRQFYASKQLSIAFATRTLVRYPTISLLAIVALGLSFVLLTLIPHLKTAIADEFFVTSEGRPDFFLFDIQDEQVEDLRSLLTGKGLKLDYLSPLVRARMTAINGEILRNEYTEEGLETREDERSEGSRNRGYNLTFRDEPFASEKIILGPSFLEMGAKINEQSYLSIERRFAERLRVGLGDQLIFDIGGVEVSGRILNIREVKWVSFQPNFFIVFPSGVLDDAPKTWIAGVLGVPGDQRDQVQTAMVERFPNVSVLDVKNISEKLSGLINAMSQVLEIVAIMAMMSGFMLLFILVNFQLQRRQWEYTLLRALGMRSSALLATIVFETMALLLMGLALGSFVSIGIANALSKVIFERWTQPDWGMLAGLLVVAMVGGSAFSFFAALRIQRRKPKEILEAN
jgi:putative ABC transport system permease protein